MTADLDHLQLADEFLKAFRDLPADGPHGAPLNWPRYFVLCHAVELALKAFLLHAGASDAKLRAPDVRHDIDELLDKAMQDGLQLGTLAEGELRYMSEAHRKFWPRYPRTSGSPVILIDHFEPYVVELFRCVGKTLRGGRGELWFRY